MFSFMINNNSSSGNEIRLQCCIAKNRIKIQTNICQRYHTGPSGLYKSIGFFALLNVRARPRNVTEHTALLTQLI